jgi:hypothetical protein
MFTGVAIAVTINEPLLDGFQEQVAMKLLPEPIALLFLQLGITEPLALKVTLEETLTSAVITIAVR